MRKPDFFIVGAQRCGTTSLSRYLAEHPRIFLTSPKEPFYFATDFPRLRRMDSDEKYLKLYGAAGPEALALGEATAGYLYSREAARNIHAFNPEARIIVMLRHPADLVNSFHAHLSFSFYEDQPDFENAWQLQEKRNEGLVIPKGCLVPEFLQYRKVGMLGEQVERLLQIIPREQVLLTFFEDFISDTGGFYHQVLDFLGVPDDGRTKFPRMNESKQTRFPLLFGLLNPRPMWMQKSIDAIKSRLDSGGIKRLEKLYSVSRRKTPLSDEMRSQLVEDFREDIDNLARLTGRDLSHWTEKCRADS